MSELNDRDLERIAGGEGETPVFDRIAWSKKNCRVCADNKVCKNKNAYMIRAKRQAEMGAESDCPFKR